MRVEVDVDATMEQIIEKMVLVNLPKLEILSFISTFEYKKSLYQYTLGNVTIQVEFLNNNDNDTMSINLLIICNSLVSSIKLQMLALLNLLLCLIFF